MNKKSVFFSIFIVFVAAALSGYALFSFITLKDSALKTFSAENSLENFYNQEDSFVFYSKSAAELAAGQAFYEIAKNKEFSFAGDKLDRKISLEEFSDKMKPYFDKMIKEYPLYNNAIDKNKGYSLEVSGNLIHFNISILLSEDKSDINKRQALGFPYYASYYKLEGFDFDMNNIGLADFGSIFAARDKCVGEKNPSYKEKCYDEQLENFNCKFGYYTITLETKKKFLIIENNNLELKNLNITFAEI